MEDKEEIAGFICGSILRKNYPSDKFKHAELNEIYVGKKYRNKGAGIMLVNNFKDWCKKNKVDFIKVNAYIKNNIAHKFYKKTGFKELGVIFQMKIK